MGDDRQRACRSRELEKLLDAAGDCKVDGGDAWAPTVTTTGHDVCPAITSGTKAFICQPVDPFVVTGPEL